MIYILIGAAVTMCLLSGYAMGMYLRELADKEIAEKESQSYVGISSAPCPYKFNNTLTKRNLLRYFKSKNRKMARITSGWKFRTMKKKIESKEKV